jgi:hypothetical protein
VRAASAIVLSGLAAAVVAVAACSSTPVVTTGTTFSAPYSIALTWGPDRDLLFIANASGDDLSALTLCTQVSDGKGGFVSGSTTLPDGRPLPVANTCPDNEDQEFLPGPIRVFPGSITAGDRPIRLAGVRLLGSDNVSAFGAVLVAGLASSASGGVKESPLIRVIDANNILAASQRTPPTPVHPPFDVELPSPAVDVVASEVPGQHVSAFVVSQAPGGDAVLIAFQVRKAEGGSAVDTASVMVPAAHCTLDLVATRLALVPGTDDFLPDNSGPAHVYVADGSPDGIPGGKGDGAVEVSVADMPPADAPLARCTVVRRLPASDPSDPVRVARPLRSIALSPRFFQVKSRDNDPAPLPPVIAPGGSILLGVTLGSSALCGVPGEATCGEGSIVILQNRGGTSRVAPAPPFDFFDVPAGAPATAPLHALSAAREITFLRPIPGCPNGANACVDISAGLLTRVTPFQIQLGAAASTDDGGTVLINVIDRRFVDDLRDERIGNATDPNAALPPALTSPTFFPTPPIGVDTPQLVFPNETPDTFTPTGLPNPCLDVNTPGCLNKGVTTLLRWLVTWHAVMPGLEGVAGTLHRDTATDAVRFEVASKDLTPWIKSPTLALQAGDVVHVRAIANPAALCPQLAATPTTQDLLIKAVEPHALVLDPAGRTLPLPFSSIPAFDFPASCGAVSLAVDIRTGSTAGGEWLVQAGTDVRGRVNQNALFVSKARRFDNPIDVPAPRPQMDIEVAFAPTGALPTFSGQQFAFSTARGTQPTTIRESNILSQGPVGDVFAYQSGHFSGGGIISPNLLFTSLTGNNAVVRSSPANIGSASALVVYR